MRWSVSQLVRFRRPENLFLGLALAGAGVFALVLVAATTIAWRGSTIGVWRFLLVGIVLFAFASGVRGGVGAALAAIVLSTAWYYTHPRGVITETDVVLRCVNYLIAGVVVGKLVESLDRAVSSKNELEGNLSVVVESVLDGLITIDASGTILSFNAAAEQMFGYERSEVIGRNVSLLMPDPYHAEHDGYLRRFEETGDAHVIGIGREAAGRRKDGSMFPLDLAVSETVVDTERVFVGIVRDITERKQAEDRDRHYRQTLEWTVRDRTRELQEQRAELEEARLDTLRRLAMAGEYHDEDTYEHTERVGASAALIAQAYGSRRDYVELIRLAAPLHDLGKLAVSDEILLKQGPLTDEEWETVRRHPAVGAAILAGSTSEVLQLAEEIARSHHEWWDGSGYPEGLRGADIPLSGRIVTLADTFDALTHDRPYKPAWTVPDAVAEIARLSGTRFDPAIVDAFGLLDARELIRDPATPALPRIGTLAPPSSTERVARHGTAA